MYIQWEVSLLQLNSSSIQHASASIYTFIGMWHNLRNNYLGNARSSEDRAKQSIHEKK